jgi:hypothetical protein
MQRTPRSSHATMKEKDVNAATSGSRIVNLPDEGAGNLSKDEYIRKLQAELEELKATQGIGPSSHKFMHSQSPLEKKKVHHSSR